MGRGQLPTCNPRTTQFLKRGNRSPRLGTGPRREKRGEKWNGRSTFKNAQGSADTTTNPPKLRRKNEKDVTRASTSPVLKAGRESEIKSDG